MVQIHQSRPLLAMFKFIWLIRDRNEWKRRSESLETKLENERAANRRYEREITSRMLTMAGQVGIAQPDPPKAKIPALSIPQPSEQSFNALTPQQQEDWSMYLEDAERNGVKPNQAWSDFYHSVVLPVFADNEVVDVEN